MYLESCKLTRDRRNNGDMSLFRLALPKCTKPGGGFWEESYSLDRHWGGHCGACFEARRCGMEISQAGKVFPLQLVQNDLVATGHIVAHKMKGKHLGLKEWDESRTRQGKEENGSRSMEAIAADGIEDPKAEAGD